MNMDCREPHARTQAPIVRVCVRAIGAITRTHTRTPSQIRVTNLLCLRIGTDALTDATGISYIIG